MIMTSTSAGTVVVVGIVEVMVWDAGSGMRDGFMVEKSEGTDRLLYIRLSGGPHMLIIYYL